MSYIKKISLFLYFSLFVSLLSHAITWDRAAIERFAKESIEKKLTDPTNGKITITVASIDPRITIKPCNIPLKSNIPENSIGRNVNIKISCNDSTPWQIYLPARIEITHAVLVAKKTIERGEVLSDSNVILQHIAENKIRGEKITDKTLIFGGKTKRRIAKGRAISRKNICLVCKGDAVTITAKSKSFTIKTQGVALSSGNINEQIKVRNKRSGKIITPQVKAINQVVINL